MSRHSKIGLLSTQHAAHEHLTAYKLEAHSEETRTNLSIKKFIEKNQTSRLLLLLFVLLGTSMVIGDGVLTPTMSGIVYMLEKYYMIMYQLKFKMMAFQIKAS